MKINIKNLSSFIILLFLVSCNKFITNEVTKSYKNGKKEVFSVKDDTVLHGKLTKFYKNGNIEAESIYENGKKTDSTIYYYNSNKKLIESIEYWLGNGFSEFVGFNESQNIISKGKYKDNIQIGIWNYYNEGKLNRSSEFINIRGESYLNQDWYFNSNGDTIKGDYMKHKLFKDTVYVGKPVLAHFKSIHSSMDGYYSDFAVVIPKHSNKNFFPDFSNERLVPTDTIPCLKYDGVDHSDLPKEVELNKEVRFEATILQKGKYHLRGYFAQYIKTDSVSLFEAKSPVDYKERKIYFDIPIYVKDTVK